MEEIKWKGPKEFNLISPEDLRREEAKRIKGSLLISGTALALLIALVFWRFPSVEELVRRLSTARPAPMSHLSAPQWALIEQQPFLSEVLSRLADAANEKVQLSGLHYDAAFRTLTISGAGNSADKITEFVRLFQQLAGFKGGKIISLTSDQDAVRFKWEGVLP